MKSSSPDRVDPVEVGLTAICLFACPSVCLSVCPSVCSSCGMTSSSPGREKPMEVLYTQFCLFVCLFSVCPFLCFLAVYDSRVQLPAADPTKWLYRTQRAVCLRLCLIPPVCLPACLLVCLTRSFSLFACIIFSLCLCLCLSVFVSLSLSSSVVCVFPSLSHSVLH